MQNTTHLRTAALRAIRVSDLTIVRGCLGLLWGGVAAYLLVFLSLTFRLTDQYSIMAYDLGIFDQALWLISQGQTPFVTVRGLHLLADHFSLILYLLAPIYALFPSPKTLMAAQTIALALGAFPLYALARLKTNSPPTALILSYAYLLYPAVQWTNAFEFHPETFATPLFLASFLYWTRRQRGLYFVMLVLAALTKETVGLTIAAFGAYELAITAWAARQNKKEPSEGTPTDWPRRDFWIGALTIGLGLLATVISINTVRHFNGGRPSPFFALYSQFGHTPGQIIGFMLTHPGTVWGALTTSLNRQYLLDLFYPFVFLALLAPEVLLIAAPPLFANLLSSRFVMHTIQHQYTTTITPFIFIAAIIGCARSRRWGSAATTGLILTYVCITMLAGVRLSPAWVWSGNVDPGLTTAQAREADQIVSQIPPQASVSVQAAFIPHLDHRRTIYTFPNPFVPTTWGYGARALRQMEQKQLILSTRYRRRLAVSKGSVDYIVLNPSTTIWPLLPPHYDGYVMAAVESPAYGIVALGKKTVLLKRGANHQKGLRVLANRTGVAIWDAQTTDRAFRAWMRGVQIKI